MQRSIFSYISCCRYNLSNNCTSVQFTSHVHVRVHHWILVVMCPDTNTNVPFLNISTCWPWAYSGVLLFWSTGSLERPCGDIQVGTGKDDQADIQQQTQRPKHPISVYSGKHWIPRPLLCLRERPHLIYWLMVRQSFPPSVLLLLLKLPRQCFSVSENNISIAIKTEWRHTMWIIYL